MEKDHANENSLQGLEVELADSGITQLCPWELKCSSRAESKSSENSPWGNTALQR